MSPNTVRTQTSGVVDFLFTGESFVIEINYLGVLNIVVLLKMIAHGS